jgi:hypothetical protein
MPTARAFFNIRGSLVGPIRGSRAEEIKRVRVIESLDPQEGPDMMLRCTFRFTEANPTDSEQPGSEAKPINGVTRAELAETMRMIEARAGARSKIAISDLPDFAKVRLRQQFDGLERFAEADVEAAIEGERDYLYRLYQNVVIR